MRRHILIIGLLSLSAFAQGKSPANPPNVKQPNEGTARTYLGAADEVYTSALQAAGDFGLDVAKAPDGSLFIASPGPWTRPVAGITFTKTFIVRVRTLNAREVEVSVEEEGRAKDAAATDRVSAFHEHVANALAENRSKKPVAPRHPLETQAEPVVVKPADLPSMRPSEETDDLRTWDLGFDRTKPVNTSVWKLAGKVPLHFTPLSERRFLVTEGTVHMLIGARAVVLAAGDFVAVPKGVRLQINLEPGTRAALFVVETPPVDDLKTVWLEPKEKPATTGSAP